jgi:hypothetical protein
MNKTTRTTQKYLANIYDEENSAKEEYETAEPKTIEQETRDASKGREVRELL